MKTIDVKDAEQMLNAIEAPKKKGRKAKVGEQKADKVLKAGHLSKKNGSAVKTTVGNKRPKAGKKPQQDAPKDAQPCTTSPALGDVIEKIYIACDARKLSLGSRRSAVSMARVMFKKYGRLPTIEEVTNDAVNPKQKGNFRWLLKLVS